MKIKIIETGAIETLSIIDPRTGCDWTADLMGNHDALPSEFDEDGNMIMHHSEFDWWKNLIDRYQSADNRYYRLCRDLNEDEAKTLREGVEMVNVDLEDYPEYLNVECNNAVANSILRNVSGAALFDHRKIANAIRSGRDDILDMKELEYWTDTYAWLRYIL